MLCWQREVAESTKGVAIIVTHGFVKINISLFGGEKGGFFFCFIYLTFSVSVR